ncbi:MAG: S49 family peptidase [Pirellulales bacterium]|nr:S49 family peptidase [Pirellulales bacterium]
MKKYPAILSTLYDTPHLIRPGKLQEVAALIESRTAGEPTEPMKASEPAAEFWSDNGAVPLSGLPHGGNASFVAVLPLFGMMFQHGGIEMDASGGVSTDRFTAQFEQLENNPTVKTIVLRIHSPGGQVFGTRELAAVIRASKTRTVSSVDSEMASAALWVGTAADEVFVTPGGDVGSIGVVTIHRDYSGFEDQTGVKTTVIAVPPAKVEGHPYEPLPEAVRGRLESEVAELHSEFVREVARQRDVSTETVRNDFGRGRMLRAKQAAEVGLVDGVKSYREVMAAEVSSLRRANSGRQQANANRLKLAALDNAG